MNAERFDAGEAGQIIAAEIARAHAFYGEDAKGGIELFDMHNDPQQFTPTPQLARRLRAVLADALCAGTGGI